MRLLLLLTMVVVLGCNGQESGKGNPTDSSSTYADESVSLPPAIMDAEVDGFIPSNMDVLNGEFKSNTYVLVSMDGSTLTDDINDAIESNDRSALTNFEKAGWILSAPAGTRFVALHADDYPYIRVQLEGVTFGKRRGYVHKKYLDLDEKGLSLRQFTSDRGRGDDWRSR